MRLEQYLITESNVTYEQYCTAIDLTFGVSEVKLSDIKDKVVEYISKSFSYIKNDLLEISEEIGVGIVDFLEALKSKDFYRIMSSIGFNLKILVRSLHDVLSILNKGLLSIMSDVTKTDLFKRFQKGTAKFDEILDEYPLLKKLSGPLLGGLLLYTWLNMTFTGKFSDDFDLSDVVDAFKGSFTLEDLFATPHGLARIILILSGPVISFPWLYSSTANLLMGILFTTFKKTNHPVAKKIKTVVEKNMTRIA